MIHPPPPAQLGADISSIALLRASIWTVWYGSIVLMVNNGREADRIAEKK
jgi:hypothetical protein